MDHTINVDPLTCQGVQQLAYTLLGMSGFHNLSIAQSWVMEKHLTPLQVARVNAANALLLVFSLTEPQEHTT